MLSNDVIYTVIPGGLFRRIMPSIYKLLFWKWIVCKPFRDIVYTANQLNQLIHSTLTTWYKHLPVDWDSPMASQETSQLLINFYSYGYQLIFIWNYNDQLLVLATTEIKGNPSKLTYF